MKRTEDAISRQEVKTGWNKTWKLLWLLLEKKNIKLKFLQSWDTIPMEILSFEIWMSFFNCFSLIWAQRLAPKAVHQRLKPSGYDNARPVKLIWKKFANLRKSQVCVWLENICRKKWWSKMLTATSNSRISFLERQLRRKRWSILMATMYLTSGLFLTYYFTSWLYISVN